MVSKYFIVASACSFDLVKLKPMCFCKRKKKGKKIIKKSKERRWKRYRSFLVSDVFAVLVGCFRRRQFLNKHSQLRREGEKENKTKEEPLTILSNRANDITPRHSAATLLAAVLPTQTALERKEK
jgi:hypothetical protein